MKIPLLVLKITPLEWALVPFRGRQDRRHFYFLCFDLLVVAQ